MTEQIFDPQTTFEHPDYFPYLLRFDSRIDFKEFAIKFAAFALNGEEGCTTESGCLNSGGDEINAIFFYKANDFGPIFETEELGNYTAVFNCIFRIDPPDWFLERVVSFPQFQF